VALEALKGSDCCLKLTSRNWQLLYDRAENISDKFPENLKFRYKKKSKT